MSASENSPQAGGSRRGSGDASITAILVTSTPGTPSEKKKKQQHSIPEKETGYGPRLRSLSPAKRKQRSPEKDGKTGRSSTREKLKSSSGLDLPNISASEARQSRWGSASGLLPDSRSTSQPRHKSDPITDRLAHANGAIDTGFPLETGLDPEDRERVNSDPELRHAAQSNEQKPGYGTISSTMSGSSGSGSQSGKKKFNLSRFWRKKWRPDKAGMEEQLSSPPPPPPPPAPSASFVPLKPSPEVEEAGRKGSLPAP